MPQHAKFRAYLALVAVYIFWGTTYLAIRISLEAFPPLLLISVRFLLSGALMLIGAKAGGVKLPRGRELWLTALFGIIILGGGNGALVWAEQTVPSGLAALLLVTSPFWMVGSAPLCPAARKFIRRPWRESWLGAWVLCPAGCAKRLPDDVYGVACEWIFDPASRLFFLVPWFHPAQAEPHDRASRGQRSHPATRYRIGLSDSGVAGPAPPHLLESPQHLGAGIPGGLRVYRGIQRVSLRVGEPAYRDCDDVQLRESGGGDGPWLAGLPGTFRCAGNGGHAGVSFWAWPS